MRLHALCILALSATCAPIYTSAWITGEQRHRDHHSPGHLHSHINETISLAAAPHSALMLATADKVVLIGLLPMLLASLSLKPETRKLSRNLLIIVPSEEDLELCLSMHSPCHLDDPAEVALVPVAEDIETIHWQGLKLAQASWRRVDYVRHILDMGLGVFLVDLDMLLLGDPFFFLSDPAYSGMDVFASADSADPNWVELTANVNMGFCYFAPTSAAKELVSMWISDKKRWDQAWLQDLLRDKAVPGLQWKATSSEMTYSYCHPRLGSGTTDHPEKDRTKTQTFHLDYLQFLLQNREAMSKLVTFHINCCNDYPTHLSCKALMMNLALYALAETA